MQISKNPNRVKILSTIVICVLVICAAILIYEFVVINNLKTKQNTLTEFSTSLEDQLNNLKEKDSYYSDYSNKQDWLEDYAREHLNWGKSDKNYYVQQ